MNVLHSLPNSILKQILERKVKTQLDRYSDLCSAICGFRSHIILELRQINELFKEYTPHDEDYHISHLYLPFLLYFFHPLNQNIYCQIKTIFY